MRRILVLLFLVFVVSLHLMAWQEPKPAAKQGQEATPLPVEYRIPAEDAKKPNPIKPTANSIAEGRHLFSSQCAMCHGQAGDGKGDLVESLQLTTVRDWTKPETLKEWTDGELFYVLTKGKHHMPGQEERMKTNQKWHLVNFIRSLSKKEAGEEK